MRQERKKAVSKKPVVFLPGLLCDERLWRDQVVALSDIADPIVVDLTLDNNITDMATRILRSAPAEFALVGLSMGGYVAFEIMRRAPQRVTQLALFDTSAAPDTPDRAAQRRAAIDSLRVGRFAGVTKKLLPQLVHASQAGGELGREVQTMAARVGQDAFLRQQQAILGRPDSRPCLGSITVRTLVGVGGQDVLTPPFEAIEIHVGIPGSKYYLFGDCGHLPSMEKPDEMNALLREWLA